MDINNPEKGIAEKIIEASADTILESLKPSMIESGKTLNLLPRTINAALAPLQKWLLYREYSVKEVEVLLEHKLKNIIPEKIVTPELYVAIPILMSISYCMDRKELREMYASILAKSMNIDTKHLVHPAHTEIIKQLSPLDANLLNLFAAFTSLPIAKYCLHKPNGNKTTLYTNVFLEYPDIKDIDQIAASIDNLNRLGLLYISYNSALSDLTSYSKFYEHEVYKNLQKSVGKPPYQEFESVDVANGVIKTTPVGRNFIKVCIHPFDA